MRRRRWSDVAGARRGPGPVPSLLACAMVAGSFAACDVPDPMDGVPEAAARYLDAGRAVSESVATGVTYRAIQSASQPWMVHLLEVDVSRCEVGFEVMGLEPLGSDRLTVPDLARGAGPGVVAAVNGDFYTEENLSLGVEARGGILRGRTSRPVFAWRPGEDPRLSEVAWQGDSLRIGDWSVVRGEPDGRTELLAGFPALLSGGEWVGDLEQAERPAFAAARHPRTAVGWDPDRRRLWVVVADGRREGVAEGMTLPELADLFRALGASEALNLDGGGSSTMMVSGRVVSRPSDPAGPRPVVNALTIREDPTFCAVPAGRSAPALPLPAHVPEP
ncbi:MAG: phosphodiester glycosidase family protein [Gemmatimonadales bacterium]|nr:MAG: phosphodiester glycosidase family protein [Gemmatimonadales bacterium]